MEGLPFALHVGQLAECAHSYGDLEPISRKRLEARVPHLAFCDSVECRLIARLMNPAIINCIHRTAMQALGSGGADQERIHAAGISIYSIAAHRVDGGFLFIC